MRLQFGGSLSKAFKKGVHSDEEEEGSHIAKHQKQEFDKVISELFLKIFVDMKILLENPQANHPEIENLLHAKNPINETLLPVSQWLLLPVDIQYQVYIYNFRLYIISISHCKMRRNNRLISLFSILLLLG